MAAEARSVEIARTEADIALARERVVRSVHALRAGLSRRTDWHEWVARRPGTFRDSEGTPPSTERSGLLQYVADGAGETVVARRRHRPKIEHERAILHPTEHRRLSHAKLGGRPPRRSDRNDQLRRGDRIHDRLRVSIQNQRVIPGRHGTLDSTTEVRILGGLPIG